LQQLEAKGLRGGIDVMLYEFNDLSVVGSHRRENDAAGFVKGPRIKSNVAVSILLDSFNRPVTNKRLVAGVLLLHDYSKRSSNRVIAGECAQFGETAGALCYYKHD
jgi:hypothetical protein